MEIDHDSLEALREKRCDVEGWLDGAGKTTVLGAIDSLIADFARGAVSLVAITRLLE